VSKILFIRGGAIGDFILTMPAIQLVRETLPETRVEVLGYEPITSLAKAASLVDDTRSIEHGPMAGFFVPNGKLDSEWMEYFGSFSVVISYLYDSDGFFRDNVERCKVDTFIQAPHRVDESKEELSAATQLAKPLEALAMYLDKPFVDLPVNLSDKVKAIFTSQNEGHGSFRIALHPGSGSPRKNWSFEGWFHVMTLIQAKYPNAQFLIISGEAEERSIAEFISMLDTLRLNYEHLEHLDLPSVGAKLQQCDLFLGHDSGISHLAGACGIPCLLLFGPTDPLIWAPQNPKVKTIVAPEGDLSRIEGDDVAQKAMLLLPEEEASTTHT
jgi:heptosyltransferase-3